MHFDRHSYINKKKLEIQERVLKACFKRGDKISLMDIGACEGESSVRYARMFPCADIFTFEPLPENNLIIQKNLAKYKVSNVHLEELCLSDQEGYINFNVSSGTPEEFAEMNLDWNFGNKSSSILPPGPGARQNTPWLQFSKTIKVKTTTLKAFWKSRNISHIDFIHLDVQGAELLVLKGAGELIQNVSLIWLEVEAIALYDGQPLKNEIEAFLTANKFIKIIDTVDKVSGDQLWANAVFVDNKLLRIKIGYLKNIYRIKRKVIQTLRKLVYSFRSTRES